MFRKYRIENDKKICVNSKCELGERNNKSQILIHWRNIWQYAFDSLDAIFLYLEQEPTLFVYFSRMKRINCKN